MIQENELELHPLTNMCDGLWWEQEENGYVVNSYPFHHLEFEIRENEIPIGFIKFYLYDEPDFELYPEEQIESDFDELLAAGLEIYNAILVDKKILGSDSYINPKLVGTKYDVTLPSLLIIDELGIIESRRKNGIASMIMNHIFKLFGSGRHKILYYFPLVYTQGLATDINGNIRTSHEFENLTGPKVADEKKALLKFYKKNGFKILKNNVLYKW